MPKIISNNLIINQINQIMSIQPLPPSDDDLRYKEARMYRKARLDAVHDARVKVEFMEAIGLVSYEIVDKLHKHLDNVEAQMRIKPRRTYQHLSKEN